MFYANSSKASDISANVKDQQLKVLQETIRNLQTQLLDNKTKEKDNLIRINALENKLKQANVKELLLKSRIVDASKGVITSNSEHASESNDSDKDVVCVDDVESDKNIDETQKCVNSKDSFDNKGNADASNHHVINDNEACLIGLISSFLVIHPFGASLENIFTYVQRIVTNVRIQHVEKVLRRYRSIFHEIDVQSSDTEISLSTQNTWTFCGFDQKFDSPTIVIHD